jgi:hypothetical protein
VELGASTHLFARRAAHRPISRNPLTGRHGRSSPAPPGTTAGHSTTQEPCWPKKSARSSFVASAIS